MHRQKTIAKWLAVILLMTIAVAIYITLSAIMGDKPDKNNNIAGANGNQNQPQNPSQNPSQNPNGNQNPSGPNTGQNTQKPPVYSTLPRKCESVNNISVAHVGGEGEEKVVDSINFGGKTAVVFDCDSTTFDVKESGIYIAIFEENTLEKTLKIAGKNAKYLTSCQTKNGLVTFCKQEGKTLVKTYDENFCVTCETSIEKYDEITALFDGERLNAFCVAEGKIKRISFDCALNDQRDNFVYQGNMPHVVKAQNFGEDTLLFLQDGESTIGVIYNQNTGFIKRFDEDKHHLLQILPIVQSSEQAFVALLKTPSGLCACAYSPQLSVRGKFEVANESFGALLKSESGVKLVTKTRIISLCSHLDFISETTLDSSQKSTQVTNTDSNADFELQSAVDFPLVLQEDNMLVARTENCHVMAKIDKGNIHTICRFNARGKVFATIAKISEKQSKISLVFDSDSQSDLTYMCFGKTDAFFISLLTSD